MNKAVFLYTFALKYSKFSWTDFAISLIITLVMLLFSKSDPRAPEAVFALYTSPAIIMFFAYTFTGDAVVNSKSLNDGEYLSLLFSRPITRASYILTKWVTASVSVAMTITWNLCFYYALMTVVHHKLVELPTPLAYSSAIANCFSFAALMVLVRSVPPKVGIMAFVVLIYTSGLGAIGIGPNSYSSATIAATIMFQIWNALRDVFLQVVFPAIDLEDAINTTRFTLMPFLTYLSNISIYLLLAIALISRREFSYAQD